MYYPRIIEQTVLETARTFPVVLVTGPRQVGKTTLLRHLAEEAGESAEGARRYVTLDDPDLRELARRDPGLFLQRFAPPVLIDEIQYAPELLPYIKMRVDEARRPGEFWLTGSQAFHLMRAVSESLAGRVGIIPMLGLSASELAGRPSEPFLPEDGWLERRARVTEPMDVRELFTRIHRGAMPALYVDPLPDWNRFYSSYTATYLERDIRALAQVADEMAFFNFLSVVAARTARPVVYEELAREAGISAPTAKKWLSLLRTSGIVALVQPYSSNLLKRVTKMPLLHMLDTGLAAWLLRWETPEALERGAMSGQFFESYVFAEICKSWLNAGREPPLFYYRDKDQREIDLLLLHNGRLMPVEIKKAATPGRRALKHFSVLAPLEGQDAGAATPKIGPGALVCMAERSLPLDARNSVVPVWMI